MSTFDLQADLVVVQAVTHTLHVRPHPREWGRALLVTAGRVGEKTVSLLLVKAPLQIVADNLNILPLFSVHGNAYERQWTR